MLILYTITLIMIYTIQQAEGVPLTKPIAVQVIDSLAPIILGVATAIFSFLSMRRSQRNSEALAAVNSKVDGVLTAASAAMQNTAQTAVEALAQSAPVEHEQKGHE